MTMTMTTNKLDTKTKLLLVVAALLWIVVGIGAEWYEDGAYTSTLEYTDLRGVQDH